MSLLHVAALIARTCEHLAYFTGTIVVQWPCHEECITLSAVSGLFSCHVMIHTVRVGARV